MTKKRKRGKLLIESEQFKNFKGEKWLVTIHKNILALGHQTTVQYAAAQMANYTQRKNSLRKDNWERRLWDQIKRPFFDP